MADPVRLFILGKGASTHPTLEMLAQWHGGGAEGGDTEEVVPSREGRSHSHRGTPPDSTRGRPCSFRGAETLPLTTLPPRNQTLVEMACRLYSGEGPLRAAPGGDTWVGGVVRLQAVPPCQSPELWGWNALQKLSPAEARRLGLSHPCIAQRRVWAGQGEAPGGGSAAQTAGDGELGSDGDTLQWVPSYSEHSLSYQISLRLHLWPLLFLFRSFPLRLMEIAPHLPSFLRSAKHSRALSSGWSVPSPTPEAHVSVSCLLPSFEYWDINFSKKCILTPPMRMEMVLPSIPVLQAL